MIDFNEKKYYLLIFGQRVRKYKTKPLENCLQILYLFFCWKSDYHGAKDYIVGALIFFFLFTIYSFLILKKQRMKSDRICVTSALLEKGLSGHGGCFEDFIFWFFFYGLRNNCVNCNLTRGKEISKNLILNKKYGIQIQISRV